MELIRSINWKEESIDLQAILSHHDIDLTPLPAGLEAEVYLVTTTDSSYVLKRWNRHSRPDVALQYAVLKNLYQQGAAVSQPYGWGMDAQGHQVLLTSYDGQPVRRLDEDLLTELARMLVEVHQIDPRSMPGLTFPSYDLASYFFPGVDQLPDLQQLLYNLLQQVQVQQTHIIHGDYNLNNILDNGGKLTIIDWTNIQLGDVRYDIAWSVVLIRIYVNAKLANQYRAAFHRMSMIDEHDYEVFEAIACLRWMLLERFGYLRYDDRVRHHVAMIVRDNRYLNDELLRSE